MEMASETTETEEWTVGELAEMFDITVRTLHHWESIGLLTPQRSEAGHRRYGPVEAMRVTFISILRGLGMSFDQVRAALDEPGGVDAHQFLDGEVERLTAQIRDLSSQRSALISLRSALGTDASAREVAIALARISGGLSTLSPDQLERLEAINAQLSEEEMGDHKRRGLAILQELRELHQAGTDPDAPAALEAWRRSRELLLETMRGDRELAIAIEHISLQPGFGDGLIGELSEEERAWLVDVNAHLPW